MNRILMLLMLAFGLVQYSCSDNGKVSIETLINEVENYQGKVVEIEGEVVHVCGVEYKKMKMKSDSGLFVKIAPLDSTAIFDKKLNHKKVRVVGIVKESRITRAYIDEKEKEKTLLCHVDHTPCKDSAWIQNKIETGKATAISRKDIKKLRVMMEKSGKEYVSVVTILSQSIEVIEE